MREALQKQIVQAVNAWLLHTFGGKKKLATKKASVLDTARSSLSPLIIAAVAFLIAFSCGASLIWLLEKSRVAEVRQTAQATALMHATRIRGQLDQSLSAAYALAALVRQGNGRISNFEQIAKDMLPLFPGVSALQLAPGGTVRQIVPLAGHEKAIGHNLLSDPARNKEALAALKSRKLTLAGPFNLVQGGNGVIGRLPVFLNNAAGTPQAFWGFVIVVVMTDRLIATSGTDEILQAGYRYELARVHPDTGLEQVFFGNSMVPLEAPLAVDVTVPNGKWTLHIAPQNGWGQPGMWAVELALLLLFGLVSGLAAYQAASIPMRLASLVKRRTRELESANTRLTQSEARFRDLTQTTSDWIWEVDAQGVYTYASPKIRELLGYEPTEVIGRRPFDFMPESEAARVAALFQGIVADRRAFALLRNINLHKDGRKIVLETSGIPLLDGDGRLIGYRGIDRDVTARCKAEEGMRKFSLAAEQNVNGMAIADALGAIEFANAKFCQMLGLEAGQVMGEELRSLQTDLSQPEIYAEMLQSLHSGQAWLSDFYRQSAEGTPIWGILTISAILGEEGVISHLALTIEDISGRKQLESKLDQFANYDQLTELPNRTLFLDRLGRAAAQALREKRAMALLMLDIDRLKNVNDSLGHHVGDELVKAVAQRLRDTLRKEDSVGRLEGDEFAALLIGVTGPDDVARIVEKLRDALKAPYRVGDQNLHVTASIGIGLFPADAKDIDSLERSADTALHRAKKTGDCYQFFSPEMNEAVSHFLMLENKLREALEHSQFLLHYQPQFDLATGRILAAEALIRWRDPDAGLLLPGRFIPLAEETGLIMPISDWVLTEACRQAVVWRDAGIACRVAVNLSPMQFRDGQILASLEQALSSTGATADLLELEITEGVIMRHGRELEILHELEAMGFRIAIDDFGSGYSSLAYLKHMPVHVLKIDGSFMSDLATSPDDRAIVSAIVSLGHALGLRVLAECVENRPQLNVLKELRCDMIQGFLLSSPLSAQAMSDVLYANRMPALIGENQ